ncbi:MAG: carboxypeptidase regulatory-like domain-containing protein [Planctomycetota bacterium]|nr:carboxypeptidase regulatory-like domain-containing protein [Planctomycetota bacterium]
MSRNSLIAVGLVVALAFLIGIFLGDQSSAPPFVERAQDEEVTVDGEFVSGEPLITDTDQAGVEEQPPAQVWGIISAPEGGVAPLAEVSIYRVRFPDRFIDRGGVSLFEVIDWDEVRSVGSRLTRLPLRNELGNSLQRVSETLADDRGRYQFHGLDAGSYLVAASAAGSLLTPAQQLIELADSVKRQDLMLLPGASLTVRTRSASGVEAECRVIVRGTMVDSSAGNETWYLSREELLLYMLNPPMLEGKTDADGVVQFDHLPPLEYTVYAQKPPLAQASKRLNLIDAREITLELVPGALIDGMVFTVDGTAVEGSIVKLVESGRNRWGEVPRPLPETISDAAGRFLLQGVPPGSFEIVTEAKGFIEGRVTGIEVESDETIPVEVVLEQGAVIRGIVRDGAGAPLPGIDVAAETTARGGRPATKVVTDEAGQFNIDTLTPGEYRLTCSGSGWRRSRERVETGPELVEVTLDEAPVLTGRVIQPGGEPISRALVQIDQNWGGGDSTSSDSEGRFRLVLEVGGDRIVVTARGFARFSQDILDEGGDLGDLVLSPAELVEGLVLSPDGSPLSGARVTASEQVEGSRRQRRASSTAWSDVNGSFKLELPQPDRRWGIKGSFPLLLESDVLTVEPRGNNVTGVQLVLRWGAEVSGTVVGEGVAVVGASVTLSYGRSRNRNRSARTDEAGQFMIRGLEAGTFSLRASAEGFGDARIDQIVLAPDEQRRVEIQLRREAELTGIVIDHFGAPMASVRVSVSDSSGAWRRSNTADDGRFSIDQLAPGLVNIRAEATGFMRSTLSDIDPALGPIEIVMDRSYELRGFVVDAETGDPISRARVSAQREGTRGSWDRASREGLFRIDGLRAGQYRVSASADGFISASFNIEVPGNDPEELIVIELEPGGRIIVDVVDLAGASVEGASLRAYRLEDDAVGGSEASSRSSSRSDARASTDVGGRGTLVGLIDGFYRVSIDHAMYIPTQSVAILKKIEGSARVRVVLERGASIRGQVRDASGNLVRNGRIVARGPVRRSGSVDDSGNYSIAGLVEGSYEVAFDDRRYDLDPAPRGQIEVSGTEQRILDLRP